MNNFKIAFQRFIKNKNTVTVLGVFAIILVLYLGYRYQINKMVSPVTGIPAAAETIQPRTKITSDMITYVDIAPIVLQDNVIRSSSEIINKYSAPSTVIPEGSLFYKGVVVTESELPDSAFVKLEEGQVPYNFPVTMDSTYGNSIYPNNYIDIYMKAYNESGTLMVGKLFENIKVLAVKDSSGQNVFENSEETRTPAYMLFAVPEETHLLLRKALYLKEYAVELILVPNTQTLTSDAKVQVSSDDIEKFINSKTVFVSVNELPQIDDQVKEDTTNDNTNTNNNTNANR